RQAHRALVLRIAWQKRALPCLAAVQRLESAEPRVAGHFVVGKDVGGRKIDSAIVIGPREEMQGIAGGDRERGLVLALQEGVSARPSRPRDHVDILPGYRLSGDTRRREHAKSGQHGEVAQKTDKDASRRRRTHDAPLPTEWHGEFFELGVASSL